ncbi:MAG: copper amine oxidase N-terminal domain-containing protein [Caldisericia bacterium]|nr:copper amine oxidase N-terminal domain-containing protein [Caldisericia bacterium]
MKRVLAVFATMMLIFATLPGRVTCDDGDTLSCGGVNRIEINDPAELKGGPNDLKTVTLEVSRSRNSDGKQIRKLTISATTHSRFEAIGDNVLGVIMLLEVIDSNGNSTTFQDIFSFSGVLSGGIGYIKITDRDSDRSIIEAIEERNNTKLVCANIKFILMIQDVNTKETKNCDETEWSDKMVDFADTTQPPNPTDVKAENDIGCLKISWAKPQKSSLTMEIDHYKFYKDDVFVKTLDPSTTYFKDCNVEAGKTYKYSISAVSPWLVEGPKAPLTVTYTPVAKIIPDKDTVDFGLIEAEKIKPVKVKLSNYGDIEADVKLEPSDEWMVVTPQTLKIDKAKRADIEISIDQSKAKPNVNYDGTVKITWGTTDFQMISVIVRIKPDTTPPDITVDQLTEVSNQLQYTVSGAVEPGASVWVNNIAATVEGDKFKATINLLPAPSATNVEVKATDKYKNTAKINAGKVINILNSKVILIIGSEKMYVNDKEVSIKPAPTIVAGKTLVPLRAVADAFGASVNWDANTRTATIVLREKTIQITLDKDTAIVNGEVKAIGSKAVNIGGRVMVPFRFIAEALGAKVDYNAETKSITLVLVVRP